jgi:hypothetical protein
LAHAETHLSTPEPTRRIGQQQAAALVFALFIAVAAWALVFHLGRYRWFHGDEWDFLVLRDGGNPGDWVRAHNEHLHALPVVVYRLWWNLFGLRSYLPYQIPVIALHLTAAVLLRQVMRRCGVHPWIATAAAGVFVLFGPGEENIVWAFQIGFTGSLTFGLAHLLLADHPGTIDRRDWLGLGAGALGLLCSTLTPFPTAVVGAVVLVRRGWRPAVFNVVPLAVAYLTWWVTIGPDTVDSPGRAGVGDIVDFVRTGVDATLESLSGANLYARWVLVIVLVAGLVVAWFSTPSATRLRRMVMPLSMLVAGLVFLGVTGYGRWNFGGVGDSSRYVHLVAAFSLPALAVAADALARKWRFGVPVAVLGFVALIPFEIGQFETNEPWTRQYFAARRELIASLARSAYITQVPRATQPDPTFTGGMTAGWLLDALDTGDLPRPRRVPAANDPTMRLRFGLVVTDAPIAGTCRTQRQPFDVTLARDREIGVLPVASGPVGPASNRSYLVQLLDDGVPTGGRRTIFPNVGKVLRAQLDDLELRITAAPGVGLMLCQ